MSLQFKHVILITLILLHIGCRHFLFYDNLNFVSLLADFFFFIFFDVEFMFFKCFFNGIVIMF